MVKVKRKNKINSRKIEAPNLNELERLTIEQELIIDELKIDIEKKKKDLSEKNRLLDEKEKQMEDLKNKIKSDSILLDISLKHEKSLKDCIEEMKKAADYDKERFQRQIQLLEEDYSSLNRKYNRFKKSIFYRLYKIFCKLTQESRN